MSEGYCSSPNTTAIIDSLATVSDPLIDFMYNYETINTSNITVQKSTNYIELNGFTNINIGKDNNGKAKTLVQYSKTDYNQLDLIRIYSPSLHYYTTDSNPDTAITASAEFIFQHSNTDNPDIPLLFVCMPIIVSDTASGVMNDFISAINANFADSGSSSSSNTTIDIEKDTLNSLITTNVPLYWYQPNTIILTNNVTITSNSCSGFTSNVVCYHINNASIITQQNFTDLMNNITAIDTVSIKPTTISDQIYKMARGATLLTIEPKKDLFIDCYPVYYDDAEIDNLEEEKLYPTKSDSCSSDTTSSSSTGIIGLLTDPIKILYILIGAFFVLGLCFFVFKATT
jgi:hypothetical protein